MYLRHQMRLGRQMLDARGGTGATWLAERLFNRLIDAQFLLYYTIMPASREPLHDYPEQFTPQDLHNALLPLESEAKPPDSPEVVVGIVDDRLIEVAGTEIPLRDVTVFILNGLRLNGRTARTGPEMRSRGFAYVDEAFMQAVGALSTRMTELTGQPIIEKARVGHAMSFRLSDRVVFEDRRHERPVLSEHLSLLQPHLCLDGQGRVQYDEYEGIQFPRPYDRQIVLGRMIAGYRDHPAVEKALTGLLDGHLRSRNEQRRLIRIEDYPPLTDSEQLAVLTSIENGLTAFVENEHPDGKTTDQIIEAVKASNKMYIHYVRIVGIIANRFASRTGFPRDELYQAGAMGLMRAVGRYSRKSREEYGDFESTAVYFIDREIRNTLTNPRDISLDAPIGDEDAVALHEALASDADATIDRQIDQIETAEAVQELFRSRQLTLPQKIVMSLLYGIFSPSLRGAVMNIKGKEPFVYPLTAEKFKDLTSGITEQEDVARIVWGSKKGVVGANLKAGFRSAQEIMRAES